MYDTLMQTVAAMAVALYSSVDKSIAAICGFAWSSILPYTIGLAVGLSIVHMLFHDDLVRGCRQLISTCLPLFIVVWLVNPSGKDGCRVVGIKNDILQMRAKVAGLVAPDFAGPPATLMKKTVERMESVNAAFQQRILTAMTEPYGPSAPYQNQQAGK
ncbi:hypothetical protein [Dechloromonas hortensis]|uniref:hypothetical protein n=1 Tax=Dechloromonas hortensis TaxID=337779 RepID=UPI001291AC5E|nr:hypothetical protein [Dechloromonas hortensis]